MTTVLFAKESDCEENPGGLDLRATLVPEDVPAYLASGYDVVVQQGLGENIGFLDVQYEMAGARIEPYPSCYAGKDLVVKLKGPSATEIAQLTPGTTLFSMGHLYCFPERRKLLEEKAVRLIGMETVSEPQQLPAAYLAGIRAGARLNPDLLGEAPLVEVHPSADQDYLNGLLRAAMRFGRRPLRVTHPDQETDGPAQTGVRVVVTSAGSTLLAGNLAPVLLEEGEETEEAAKLVAEELGRPARVIGQIREVGIGGAKYGLDLYHRLHDGADPAVLVLGYGNTSMGAFEHLRAERIPFTVLGRDQTSRTELPAWLRGAGLVINGAETPGGTEYILTTEQAHTDVPRGAVVIDLIGGSPAKRSPVEPFEWTTFLTQIHFESQGRYFAGLWGWDMYYSMHDTAKEYSRRVSSVLNRTPAYAASLDTFADDYAYARQLGA
ncbi:alanine dehydrogenase/PNT-like protein [Streptomyces sp. TLI_55]|uniref:hypothetical protein n=1 Tax=Streptomyces sp. TLI_55 TaxID=1938861 RepID=UPI000BDAB7AF|nr:hypothetical protein [Streptomyces sp. TLI_55]SNX88542.1 alanine dehydrogenase/PNT-like protein [Streptomyces sp. TLI_55]